MHWMTMKMVPQWKYVVVNKISRKWDHMHILCFIYWKIFTEDCKKILTHYTETREDANETKNFKMTKNGQDMTKLKKEKSSFS